MPINYSVVIPCFDERDSIAPLLHEVEAAVGANAPIEIIVVDDCSRDDTLNELMAVRAALSLPLRILVHTVNCGQSAALCHGIEAAAGEWIVTLDGDGQNDPADIPHLLTVLETETQQSDTRIICGHRTQRRDSTLKRLSSRIANTIRRGLLRDATPDTGCGLKLIRRDAFLRLPRFDHMHRFLPALILRDGGRVVSVAVRHRARQAGQSKYGVHNRLWAGIVDLLGVLWLRRRQFNSNKYEER